jgi:hypothetical protein
MRAFGGSSAGNVGGRGCAVKSGVLYPASRRMGSAFAPPEPIFSRNCRQTVANGARQRRLIQPRKTRKTRKGPGRPFALGDFRAFRVFRGSKLRLRREEE